MRLFVATEARDDSYGLSRAWSSTSHRSCSSSDAGLFWINLIVIRRNGYPYRNKDIHIAIRISIASYHNKSWHTPKNFSVAFFFFIILQNMASEAESEALDSINTSELKNTRGRSALLT